MYKRYVVHEFFLLADGGFKSFDKSDFKSRWMEEERKKFYIKLIFCFFSIISLL